MAKQEGKVVVDIKPQVATEFVRMRRKGNGWIVERVGVIGDKVVFRKDEHDWDTFQAAERRLTTLASAQEMSR